MVGNFPFVVVGLLFAIGMALILFDKNLIKIAIGVSMLESATELFLIVLDYGKGGSSLLYLGRQVRKMVLPTPQGRLHIYRHGRGDDSADAFPHHVALSLLRHPGVREIRRLRG